MGIGEIKNWTIAPSAAASTRIPFEYKPALLDIALQHHRRCAELHDRIKYLDSTAPVVWKGAFAILGLSAASLSLYSIYVGERDYGRMTVLALLTSLSISVSRFTGKLFTSYNPRMKSVLIHEYESKCMGENSPAKLFAIADVHNKRVIVSTDFHPEIYGVSPEAIASRHSVWALVTHDVGSMAGDALKATGHGIVTGAKFIRDNPGKTAMGVGIGALILFQPEFAPAVFAL